MKSAPGYADTIDQTSRNNLAIIAIFAQVVAYPANTFQKAI
jgi:hypothetical protein